MRVWISVIAAATVAWMPATAQPAQRPKPATRTCPGDRIVWVNTRSGVYHYRGERYLGGTKEGRFLCEKAAGAEGDRPTRNGQ